MNDAPAPPDLAQRPDLSERLGMMLTALRAILAARGGRDRSVGPLIMLACNYLSRLARRFEALARRVRAGDPTLTSPRARAPRAASAESPEPRPRPPGLPRTFAWMVRLTQPAANISWALKLLLAEPEFAAFLAAAPRAARLLRPLCRMLAISRDPDLPAALIETPRPRPARPRPTRRRPRPAAAASPAPLAEPEPPGGWPLYPGELTREDVLSWPCFRDSPA